MMSRTPHRQTFHLPLSNLESPVTSGQMKAQPNSPFGTPYSPYRSAELKPPTPYGGPMRFAPRGSYWRVAKATAGKLQYLLSKRPFWFVIVFLGLLWWWGNGGREDLELVKLKSAGIKNELFAPELTRGLQFYPASNPKIHYVGRWTATPNRLRKDGTFAGVYFDLVLRNSTSLYLSLHNQPENRMHARTSANSVAPSEIPDPGHLSFRPTPLSGNPALPVSLLARVDQDEYVLLPNSSALVAVRVGDLDANGEHFVRIIAPGNDDNGKGVIELEGIWVSKGGKLGIVEGSNLEDEVEEEDDLQAENANIGESHRLGLTNFAGRHPGSTVKETEAAEYGEDQPIPFNKLIEIVTDSPGSVTKQNGTRSGSSESLLAGVTGWEYLIGEMFNVDHATIAVDGMCLVEDCIGGTGSPLSISDVFFRSGPTSTPYFTHSWMFQSYVPSVLLLNLGSTDYASFTTNPPLYPNTTTTWDLVTRFEDAYISLVKSIRALAYPTHPAMLRAAAANFKTTEYAPSNIPIFVMRPLLGELEHATQGAVRRLREDGDKAVYWLDTSGWLEVPTPSDAENPTPDDNTKDFYLDTSSSNPSITSVITKPKYRLTQRGNLRTSIFLHTHLCRFLTSDEARDKCAFFEPEDYVGRVFKSKQSQFDKFVDDDKERRLRKLFWGEVQGDVLR